MMTRGRGVTIPPKNDDVIYEQPLMMKIGMIWIMIADDYAINQKAAEVRIMICDVDDL